MIHDLVTTPEPGMGLYRHKCLRCGVEKFTQTERWYGACKGAKGLGDYVEMFAKRIARLFGFGKCGGCQKRKRWLNSLTKGK